MNGFWFGLGLWASASAAVVLFLIVIPYIRRNKRTYWSRKEFTLDLRPNETLEIETKGEFFAEMYGGNKFNLKQLFGRTISWSSREYGFKHYFYMLKKTAFNVENKHFHTYWTVVGSKVTITLSSKAGISIWVTRHALKDMPGCFGTKRISQF